MPNDKAPRALGTDEKIGYETVQRASPDYALGQAKKKLAILKRKNKREQMAKLDKMKIEKEKALKKLEELKKKQ